MDDAIYDKLAPLTDWIPEEIRSVVKVEVWWAVEVVVLLAVMLIIGLFLRGLFRGLKYLFVWERRRNWEVSLLEALPQTPPPNPTPSVQVYHVPGWVRLIVVAPVGKQSSVSVEDVIPQLERTIPGIRGVLYHDRPRISIWPAQMSIMGFANSFHRSTPREVSDHTGEPSDWVMLAGKVQVGNVRLFVGMAIQTQEKTTFGRINLDQAQWFDVLRLLAKEPT